MIPLSIYNHHLIKNNRFFSLNKLSSRELYNMQIIKNNEKPSSQSYCNSFFCTTNLVWRKIYLLTRKTTINMKLLVFQCKTLNNVLYLNKMIFRFGKVKSSLCSFCKSSEETSVHLFSSSSLSQNIWSQTQVFFSNYFTILNILPQSAILVLWKKFKINVT